MEWTNELILLAPRVLQERKFVEDRDFIGLYTSVEGKLSEYDIYLAYKFTSTNKYYWLNYCMKQLKFFYNVEFYNSDKGVIILYTFRCTDDGWSNFKDYKKTLVSNYNLQFDWVPIFTFWGDRIKEMPHVYEEYKVVIGNKLKRGCDCNPLFYSSSKLKSV